MAKKGKKSDDGETLGWVMLAGGAGLGLIFFLTQKKASRPTETMPVAPLQLPGGFASLGAVSTRFDEVRELYTMGYLSPEDARVQVGQLAEAAAALVESGRGDRGSADLLVRRISQFLDTVLQYEKLVASGA
jgi:hypothetical protein